MARSRLYFGYRIREIFPVLVIFLSLLASGQNGQGKQKEQLEAEKAALVDTNIATIKAFVSPPRDFNFDNALPSELARYGLPPRPDPKDAPSAFALWKDIAEGSRHRVIPVLEQSSIIHGPVKNLKIGTSVNPANIPAQSDNWSGFVITSPTNAFNQNEWITALFTVPAVMGCYTAAQGFSSNWVGIDGWGSNDVLQVGTASENYCGHGIPTAPQGKYYGWYEWYPDRSYAFSNLIFGPGDVVLALVVANTPYPNKYVLTLYNKTRVYQISMPIQPPSGTQLIGNSAEWVLERPTVNGSISQLTAYYQNAWLNLYGSFIQSGQSFRPSSPLSGTTYTVTMVDPQTNNATISVPTLYSGPTNDLTWFLNDVVWQ